MNITKHLPNPFRKKVQLDDFKDLLEDAVRHNANVLVEFETAYQEAAEEEGDAYKTPMEKDAKKASGDARTTSQLPDYDAEEMELLLQRIVQELVARTPVIHVKDGVVTEEAMPALPDGYKEVTREEVHRAPEQIRPQLTGNLMAQDIATTPMESTNTVLSYYKKALYTDDPKKAFCFYEHFRQGLDMLPIDMGIYVMLGRNRLSMSYWLPALARAANIHGFFRIPETRIARVPATLLQMTRLQYETLTPATLKITDDWAYRVFRLDETKEYFIKTGTHSSKFFFRNAHVKGEKEVRELGEYLLYIHNQAVDMAGPLSQPSIYGIATTNEWVVREYIPDQENNPTIYSGLPLHTEYRVFVDCDTDEVLGPVRAYWDPEIMKKRFSQASDADSVHKKHDYIIYAMHEKVLMDRYEKNKDLVLEHVREMLPDIELEGQWSIDIMQNGTDFWLIDMATADRSALNDQIPREKLKKTEESWIPEPVLQDLLCENQD